MLLLRSPCAACCALVLHLVALHLFLTRFWYGGGFRKAFTTVRNVHVNDLMLAVEIARGDAGASSKNADKSPLSANTAVGIGRLALLFMLRRRLEHVDLWKSWLEPEASRAVPRVSLYFHLADGLDKASPEDVAALRALPGARQIVATVATGWCELMAAEVALIKAALADDLGATLFVLLPHDAVMLAPLELTLAVLLSPSSSGRSPEESHQDELAGPRSRICLAGVRGLEVPSGCPHAIEPHWSRSLLLKHHQWMALSRAHAERVSDAAAIKTAVDLFQEWLLGEPLCSDEVIPLLSLASSHKAGTNSSSIGDLHQLPLYKSAARGLRAFDDGLRDLDIAAECITYAPWPGCRPVGKEDKTAKSPTVGGGLSPHERDAFMVELAAVGVFFCRKLGLGSARGGIERPSVSDHLDLISAAAATHRDVAPGLLKAPRRLLPLSISTEESTFTVTWPRQFLWAWACLEASTSVVTQCVVCAVVATCAAFVAMKGSLFPAGWFERLVFVFVVSHLVFFFFSVALFAEYSLLQPLRRVGFLSMTEL